MKANEAPERIYLNPLLMEDGESIVRRCTFERQRDSQIEYIRKDAFIEKADKFISSFFHPDDTELKKGILDEFHKYMEESKLWE